MNPDALLTELGELATALGPAVRPAGTDELLRSLTETARRLFGAAACSLALLSEDESELIYTVAAGEGADDVTGMRISEALALRMSDITDDGLIIEKTKFKKSRLLPLHPSTRRALNAYLAVRLRVATGSDAVLIGNTGEAVAYPIRILAYHHVINDVAGGTPIVATY